MRLVRGVRGMVDDGGEVEGGMDVCVWEVEDLVYLLWKARRFLS